MTYTYTDKLYSDTQLKILFGLPILPGLLSAICSGLILYVIFSDSKRKLKRVYHRALVGYSIIDILVSVVYIASSVPVPKGTPGTFGAIGNWTTCQISGFLLQFSMSKAVYWAFICLYYIMMVKYRVREEKIVQLERIVHSFAFVTPIGLGIAMLHLDNYNPTNIIAGLCFLNCYPANCLRDDAVECERGEHYFLWSAINMVPVAISFQVGLFSLVLTCLAVRKTHVRQSRWSFMSSSDVLPTGGNHDPDTRSSEEFNNRSLRRGLSQARRWPNSIRLFGFQNNSQHNFLMAETTRQVCIQTMLYIASYILTLTSYIVTQISVLALDGVQENRRYYFFWASLVKITLPSTGIWNFLIYCRPRLISLRKQNPESSFLELLRHIVLCSNQEELVKTVRRPQLQGDTNSVQGAARVASTVTKMNDRNSEIDFTPELEIHTPHDESNSPTFNHSDSTSTNQYASDEPLDHSISHGP